LIETLIFILATIHREFVLLPKDVNANEVPKSNIMSFDGRSQSLIVKKSDFSGHLNNEFIIRVWMKHSNYGHDDTNNDKEHIFCKTDDKCK
jgi:hypothetical protein